jgi:hypothetical protein
VPVVMPRRVWIALFIGWLVPHAGSAQLTHIVIDQRQEVGGGQGFGSAGPYERLIGRAFFEFDPENPHNGRIVDLRLAERNGRGKVAAWSEISVLQPKDPRRGNGTALIDVVNRGRPFALFLNRQGLRPPVPSVSEWDLGDGFLLEQGYTVVFVGWQWDVLPDPTDEPHSRLRLHAPSLPDSVVGTVRVDWTITPGDSTLHRLPLAHRNSTGYPVADTGASARLTVRETPSGSRQLVPRGRYRFEQDRTMPELTWIRMDDGFVEGKIYELTYLARGARVVGVGLLALRDLAAYLKYDHGSPIRARRTIAFGYSQTARLLRHYLYEGLNTDSRGRKALDGVFAFVAGAGRGSFNHRFAEVSRDRTMLETFDYPVDLFPHTSRLEADPVTGARDALLDNARAARNRPKVFQVNTGYEYWGGAASLLHTDVLGSEDIAPLWDERLYLISSASHLVATLPESLVEVGGGARGIRGDPLDAAFPARALLEALRGWIEGRAEPLPSQVPTLATGHLVSRERIRFPAVPGVDLPAAPFVPRRLDFGPRWNLGLVDYHPPLPGLPFTVMLPQVDSMGHELGGIPSVETLAPLGTYTGWRIKIGPMRWGWIFPYSGMFVPLPRTEVERASRNDPRPSLERLYPSAEAYRARVSAASRQLVRERFLLARDTAAVAARADSLWQLVH